MIRSLLSFRSLSILAAVVTTFACAEMASAAEGTTLINLTPYIGIGLAVIGSAFGISRLAAAAYESMARTIEGSGELSRRSVERLGRVG